MIHIRDIKLDKPVLVMSLDLELAWGFILYPEHKVLAWLQKEPPRARQSLDILLKLLEEYDIPATWLITGHLFFNSGEADKIVHPDLPQFKEGWINWEHYSAIKDDPLYCGKDIVKKIVHSPVKHEIGLHGFFHLPLSQCSQEVARAEIELGKMAATNFNLKLMSYVFPENEIGHVNLLKEHGFHIYRGKDVKHWNKDQRLLIRKFNSAIDKILVSPVTILHQGGPLQIPGSLQFYDPSWQFTLLPRAKLGLNRAIRTGKVFHFWLHPGSILIYKKLAKDLESFLKYIAQKRNAGKLQVMTMGELASACEAKDKAIKLAKNP